SHQLLSLSLFLSLPRPPCSPWCHREPWRVTARRSALSSWWPSFYSHRHGFIFLLHRHPMKPSWPVPLKVQLLVLNLLRSHHHHHHHLGGRSIHGMASRSGSSRRGRTLSTTEKSFTKSLDHSVLPCSFFPPSVVYMSFSSCFLAYLIRKDY
ncbi:unnamed protein product, partial [Musa acuminata subsp. burmannicoides]